MTMLAKPLVLSVLALSVLWPAGAAMADGLNVSTTSLGGSRWQARVEVENLSMRVGGLAAGTGPGASVQSARLLGDYQLDALRFGQTGGLRLTSGLLLAQRQGLSTADTETRTAWPYVGLGYSGNGARGDWGFSADFGMAAQSLGATLRLGRVVNGGLSVGDALRDLRLQPVVRLGVTYNF